MKLYNKKINWLYTIFFLVIQPLLAVVGTVLWAIYCPFSWGTVILATVLYFATGIGITAGYHRLMSHKAYEAHPIINALLLFFGTATLQGSVLEWCSDHRRHHLHEGTEKDPYNINQGFFYAHLGWILTLDPHERDFSNVEDLNQNPLIRFQHKHFKLLGIITGFLVPALLASIWGDFWGGLFVAGALRMLLVHHSTFFINSLAHTLGDSVYENAGTAKNNWITSVLAFGEGYHNFHHKFAMDYRNGIKAYHYDPTKWLIGGLSKIGLTKNLKKVPDHIILKYHIQHDESRITKLLEHTHGWLEHFNDFILPAKNTLLETLSRLEELEKRYAKLIKDHQKDYIVGYKNKLRETKKLLRLAKKQMKHQVIAWQYTLKKSMILAK